MSIVVILKNNQEIHCECVEFEHSSNSLIIYDIDKRTSVNTWQLKKVRIISVDRIKTIY